MHRHASRDESEFTPRKVGGFEYYQSQVGFDDASLMVYRFPCQGEEKAGPDFVLVHGIGVSARAFGPTALLLAREGDVHLVDLAGYGRSPRPDRDMTIADHADLLARYLRTKELDHPVVVGHSMGTQVVAELAARHPAQVDRIVLVAPVMMPDARTAARAGLQLAVNGLREPIAMSAVAVTDYFFRTGVSYMIEQIPHLLGGELEEVAAGVEAEALVLCGDRDPVATPEWGRELADTFPRGRYATVRGPHGAMWVSPKTLAAHIDQHAHR